MMTAIEIPPGDMMREVGIGVGALTVAGTAPSVTAVRARGDIDAVDRIVEIETDIKGEDTGAHHRRRHRHHLRAVGIGSGAGHAAAPAIVIARNVTEVEAGATEMIAMADGDIIQGARNIGPVRLLGAVSDTLDTMQTGMRIGTGGEAEAGAQRAMPLGARGVMGRAGRANTGPEPIATVATIPLMRWFLLPARQRIMWTRKVPTSCLIVCSRREILPPGKVKKLLT